MPSINGVTPVLRIPPQAGEADTYINRLGDSLLWEFRADESLITTASDGTGGAAADSAAVGYIGATAAGDSSQPAIQATTTKKPLYHANYDGNGPAVVFDGVDDMLELSDATNLALSSWYAIFVLDVLTGIPSTATFMARKNGAAYDRLRYAAGKIGYQNSSPAYIRDMIGNAELDAIQVGLIVEKPSSVLIIDLGGPCIGETHANATITGDGTIQFGTRGSDQYAKFALRHMIIGDATSILRSDLVRAQTLVAAEWGVSL